MDSTTSKWYNSTGLVVFLCIIFPPVGLYGLWKSIKIAKALKIIITVIVVIISTAFISGILALSKPISPEQQAQFDIDQKNERAKQAEKKEAQTIIRLEKVIANIDSFNGSIYRESVESIKLELALFESWSKMANDYASSIRPEEKQLAAKLATKAKALQKKEFPQLRKAYALVCKDKLWENDIDVSLSSDKIINITGGCFAANKNIKDFQQNISSMLESLRFKEVRYRWYKGDDEFTYYKIGSINDSDL